MVAKRSQLLPPSPKKDAKGEFVSIGGIMPSLSYNEVTKKFGCLLCEDRRRSRRSSIINHILLDHKDYFTK
jgi:hypothetical protein